MYDRRFGQRHPLCETGGGAIDSRHMGVAIAGQASQRGPGFYRKQRSGIGYFIVLTVHLTNSNFQTLFFLFLPNVLDKMVIRLCCTAYEDFLMVF